LSSQNAFYNDVHFHYGYFIFAAAVVAHFDPEWGRTTFENVLLLIRCIANPSEEDDVFPTWRHKDWYQGHSWASGIAMVFLNGKNQESSSEAIAAYEAVALYGKSMVCVVSNAAYCKKHIWLLLSHCYFFQQISAWEEVGSRSNAQIALEVEQAGQLLVATELRSARTYWHVTAHEKIKIYPSAYTPRTIGMLWQTMAQCQTWFGAAAYLAYGIQLLPLTPISEYRDTLTWSKEMYHILAESCGSDPECTSNGWSVVQLAMLATVGHQEESAEIANALSLDVFESAGGNGHSLSNSLWYFATRPAVKKPLALTKAEKAAELHNKSNNTATNIKEVVNCGKPGTCTDYVLDTIAGEYSCRQRMDWLVQIMGKTENEACIQIARIENPHECGACDPERKEDNSTHQQSHCAHCSQEACESNLNRCPLYEATFVCTEGDSVGGCSSSPWNVPSAQCRECCELTHCVIPSAAEKRAKQEADCPPCTKTECRSSKCASSNALQYYCLEGLSAGGCGPLPWETKGLQCSKCCSLFPHC
jgi:Glycosyl hydrolase family 81 C-terminal domain